MQMLLEIFAYFLGIALAALAVPILWIGYFFRSPLLGALAGLCTAAFLMWGSYYSGNSVNFYIIIACILDGLLFGFLGKKYRKPKK